MNRERLARECLEIERAGGSVREYLRSCGCVSPWGTWFRLQKEELGRKEWQITDGKGGDDMKKIALADKKKAVEIAIAGGDPLLYLRECGSKNPANAWYVIKKNLEKADPETYARLPDLRKAKEEPEETEADNPVDVTSKPMMVEVREEDFGYTADAVKSSPKSATKPVNYGGFDVLSVREPETGNTFCYDPRGGVMEWRTEAGDEVIMHPDHWRNLAEKIPQVLEIFGI